MKVKRLQVKFVLLLAIMAAAVSLSGCGDWVAKVNGQAIDTESFKARLAEMQTRFAGQAPAEDSEGFNSFRGTVAEDMAVRLLLKEEAERLGLSVSPEEVEQGLAEVKKNQFSGNEQKFQESLDKQGITLERAKQQLAEGMLLTKLKIQITSEVPEPSDDEAKIAYEKNPKKYEIAPQAKARHIQLVSEADAQSALARLTAGEDFAALAAELSTDTSTKDKGGDLGWVLKGAIEDDTLNNAIFEQMIAGTYSEPVKSKYGWHILRVEDTKPAVQRSLEESKLTIKKELLENAQDIYWSGWLIKVKQGANIQYRDGYQPPEGQQ